MQLKIRYENEYQTIILNDQETDELWVSLGIESEDLPKDEREERIQKSFDVMLNYDDYNSWHRQDRHKDKYIFRGDDNSKIPEKIMKKAKYKNTSYPMEDFVIEKIGYEVWEAKIKATFPADTADMLIAIAFRGLTVADYASSIGDEPNNVSHRYRRAVEKFKKIFPLTSF